MKDNFFFDGGYEQMFIIFANDQNSYPMSPRPKRVRKVIHPPGFRGFKPFGCPESKGNDVKLLLEEFEAIKLADYEKLSQAEAAEKMEVSRPTFSRIYESARGKVAKAFIETTSIVIEGGNVDSMESWFHCMSCHTIFRLRNDEDNVASCPVCSAPEIEQINTPESTEIGRKNKMDNSYCICPKCEFKTEHIPGEPCRTKFCPTCNISLIREHSTHHKQLIRKIKNNKHQ